MARKAIIIGAGIAGLSAAIALQQAGWQVELYEQATEITAMGAALSLWPNAIAALDRLGFGATLPDVTERVDQMALARSDGRQMLAIDVGRILTGSCARMVTRTDLQALLMSGLSGADLMLDHTLSQWGEDANGVWAQFANGHRTSGDVLIAADGLRSAIAAEVIGGAVNYAGYGGVLALTDPVGCGRAGVEHWAAHQRFGVFPIKDGRSYWFYMRTAAGAGETATLTLSDINDETRGWCDLVQRVIAATPADRLIPFAIHAKPPPKRLGKGRIICVGDAAHAMEPNLGQGACQALEDAVALGAAACAADTNAILARFETMRLARVRKFVSLSRQGGLIAHRFPALLPIYASRPVSAASGTLMSPVQRGLYSMPDYSG